MTTFAEAFRDLEAAVAAFCEAVRKSSNTSVGVVLGTPASTEIQPEPSLGSDDDPEPVKGAHTRVKLGHLFVNDQLATLARLPLLELPSVFGPYVIARSLLDTAGATYWLAEPDIGAERRVQRRLITQLLEARTQQVPGREEFSDKAAELKAVPPRVGEFCSAQGWRFENGDVPRIEEEQRPSHRVLLGEVVDNDRDNLSAGLGATLWWFLSGYTHGSLDALVSVLERNPESGPTSANAVIVVNGVRLVWLIFATARAARRLTERRGALFGEMASDVEETGHELDVQLLRYLEAAKEGRLP
jgi:hypothetical protein